MIFYCILAYFVEDEIHVLGGLCTCLGKQKTGFLRIRSSIFLRHLALCRGFILAALLGRLSQVELRADQSNHDARAGLSLQLLDPRLGLIQRGLSLGEQRIYRVNQRRDVLLW